MEYSSYLGSHTTNDIRCTRELKFSIAMTKAVKKKKKKDEEEEKKKEKKKKKEKEKKKKEKKEKKKKKKKEEEEKKKNTKKKTLFTRKLGLNLGREPRTLRKVDQKYFASFEMWRWRRTEKFSWTDRVKNEVLQRVKEDRNILHTIKRRTDNRIYHIRVLRKKC